MSTSEIKNICEDFFDNFDIINFEIKNGYVVLKIKPK